MTTTQTNPAPTTPPTPDAPPIIKCVGLTKVFKDFWLRPRVTAVDAIDLDVRRGEVFGLLGPNGSGKSTTIKMLLGLLQPTAGKIAVFSKLPTDVATKKRIGYLPEESYLYKFLTARETLEYYGKLFHLPTQLRKQRIDTLLEMVGLEHAARRPVGEFSKGMTRKIGLAQALINDPELLILDEPTSGMDPIATADVKRVILQLKERGKTVLLCSHLLADVEDVTDRVAIMFGGKVRQRGPVNDLLTQSQQTTITTGPLAGISEEQLVTTLESAGVTDLSISHPRMKLEQLFLDIVAQAQAEGVGTAGAKSGGRIADFLSAGQSDPQAASQPEADAEAVLANLQRFDTPDEPAEAEGSAPAADTDSPTPPPPDPTPAGDEALLAQLTGQAPPTSPPTETPKPQADPAAVPPPAEADQGVLDDLMGRKPSE
ncbi:MAG: ABC transporter ATP-binding protein [Planctomycetota bacterium]